MNNNATSAATILVVEDDELLNKSVRRLLDKEGMKSEGFLTGAAGLERVFASPDNVLLLLDYSIPDLTAKQFVDMVRERGLEIPFMIITGHGDEMIAVEMMKLGAVEYIVKSIQFHEILPAKVKHACEEIENRKKLAAAEAEHKQDEKRECLFRDVLSTLNRPETLAGSVRDILLLIKNAHNVEAAGIRLRDGDDFPYVETNGFPEHFVETERHLCARDEKGNIVRDKTGTPALECMCGNVLCGRTDPAQPFFTKGGSFWTNGTTQLLATTTEKDRQARTRNRCNGEGYESVALIPLRTGDDIIGLLQLNDRRKDRFSIETIQYLEGLGQVIGIALSRKKAEEALKTSETKLRAVIDAAPFPVAMVDSNDDKILFWSRSALTLFGHTAPTSAEWYKLAYPDPECRHEVVDRWKPFVEKARSTGKAVHAGEYRVTCKNGSIRICELYAAFVADNLVVTFNDITERKRAEETLRQSEEKFRTLADLLPALVYEMDLDGKVTYVNQFGFKLTGYEKEGLPENLPAINLISPEDRPRALKTMQDVLRGKASGQNEYMAMTKEGKRFPVLSTSSPILYDGKPVGLRGIIFDITERNLAETALRESEERYRTLFDDAKDGIALADSETGKIVECNQALCAMVGMAKSELIGQMQSIIHPPQDLVKGQSAAFVQHKTGDAGTTVEDRIISKSGVLTPVEIRPPGSA